MWWWPETRDHGSCRDHLELLIRSPWRMYGALSIDAASQVSAGGRCELLAPDFRVVLKKALFIGCKSNPVM